VSLGSNFSGSRHRRGFLLRRQRRDAPSHSVTSSKTTSRRCAGIRLRKRSCKHRPHRQQASKNRVDSFERGTRTLTPVTPGQGEPASMIEAASSGVPSLGPRPGARRNPSEPPTEALRPLSACTPGEPPLRPILDKPWTWLNEPNDYESVGRAFESPGAHQLETS
jgi:hypothetical protein